MNESEPKLRSQSHRWLEALEWHASLSEGSGADLAGAQFPRWERWHANPENREVFQRLDRLLQDRCHYLKRLPVSHAALEADDYDPSVPVEEWRRDHVPASGEQPGAPWVRASTLSHRSRRKSMVGVALAAAAVLSGLLILQPQWFGIDPAVPPATTYQTNRGELKTIQLSDGSLVTLGGQTKVSVDYSPRARTVQLYYGEAWFEDRDLPNRPFVVTAGGGTITAVGTAFVVNRDADRVVVTVTSGIVDVAADVSGQPLQHPTHDLPGPRLSVVRITRGEALTYSNRAMGPVVHANAPAATSWAHGRLIFDDVPLRYVVQNVDRYWSRKIIVDPQAGALRFSGQIYEGGIENWLRGLPDIFPVTTQQSGTSISVRMRSPQSDPSAASSR